jgi:hypothetical protein
MPLVVETDGDFLPLSFKADRNLTAHFSIVQSDIENYHIIKAIHYFIKGPEHVYEELEGGGTVDRIG